MDKLYEELQQIRICPAMYIGKISLERLKAYIDGYRSHDYDNFSDDCLNGFNKFVADRYAMRTTHDWSSLICFFTADEKDAFNEFYKLLDEFVKEKKRRKRKRREITSAAGHKVIKVRVKKK